MEKELLEILKDQIKQKERLYEANWRLLTIVEFILAKPELINDEKFKEELQETLNCCY